LRQGHHEIEEGVSRPDRPEVEGGAPKRGCVPRRRERSAMPGRRRAEVEENGGRRIESEAVPHVVLKQRMWMRGGRGVGTSCTHGEEAEARRVAAPGQPGRELRAPGRCWRARADSSLDEEGHVPRRRSTSLLRCVAARGGGAAVLLRLEPEEAVASMSMTARRWGLRRAVAELERKLRGAKQTFAGS
jgi:hypothetical protein